MKILRYVSLTDAGKMIHPIQCHAQDEGAAVFGIGQALFEDLVYQDGQLVNGSLVDYRLPRFDDLPESFTTFIMEGGGGPGPYGAKGMGEGGILAVAPAVANAVHNAIAVRMQAVPLISEMASERGSTSQNCTHKPEIELQPRIDLREKVTGQAQYVEDLPDLPLTAYGATLLSPYCPCQNSEHRRFRS